MSYLSTVLADNPIAYYRLDEASGSTITDSSGNGRNGTTHGSIVYSASGALTNDSDSAMGFDGSTTYISIPTIAFPTGASAWTVEGWAKVDVTPGDYKTIASFGTYSVGKLAALFLMSDMSALLSTYSGDIRSASNTIALHTWYHVAGTYDGASTRLYLNGQLVAGPTVFSLNVALAFASIGAGNSPQQDFINGFVDEVAYYNYALSAAQIANHYAIGSNTIGSNAQYNLSVYKEQQILVYKPDGTFVDCVRDAPLLSGFKESINAVTSSLKVQLPRKFEQIDLPGQTNAHGIMQQGYVWKYYLFGPGLPTTGLLRYSGQVDEYAPQINENGEETIAVTLTPQGSAIADSGLGATATFGTPGQPSTYSDVIDLFNFWFNVNDPVTGQTYCYPLTLDPSNPYPSGVTVQYTWTNQTIKSILDTIILMLPANYFYRTNPDNTVTLNQTPLTAQHVLQVGVHISNPQYSQSWVQTQTAVFFLGGQDPTTVTTANPNGNPIIAIKRGIDMKTIGKRLYLHNESRVIDQATANTLAQGDINYYDQAMLRTKIRVPDYRGPNPSIGYDIESIKVGDSIQIQDNTYNGASTTWDNSKWGSGIWDQSPGPALNTVGVISALTYGWHYVDIEIGLPQPNLARAVSALQQKMQDFSLI